MSQRYRSVELLGKTSLHARKVYSALPYRKRLLRLRNKYRFCDPCTSDKNRVVTNWWPLASSCFLLAGIFVLLETGRRLGTRKAADNGTAVVNGAVFGLVGLMLALTFSGAASRWEWRRNLAVEEANAIGTAYLRLDLLPLEYQPALRATFRSYLQSRLAFYSKPDFAAAKKELEHSNSLQMEIWRQAVAATERVEGPAVMTLVLTNINEMLDITTTRTMALRAHLPLAVLAMLGITVLVASLLAGYSMVGTRTITHRLCFALLLGMTVYLILELEFPRMGFFRIDDVDQVLAETLEQMK